MEKRLLEDNRDPFVMEKTTKCKKFVCVVLILIELSDLLSDWFFYVDMAEADKGLVYGPIEINTLIAILVFTIVGTVASPIEIVVTVIEWIYPEKSNEKILDRLSLSIIILEDIPQAILLLVVALCREEPSSVFQLVKASFIILTGIIKALPVLVTFCRKGGSSKLNKCVLIGSFIEILLAVFAFMATQVEISDNGGFHFPKPTTIVEERFNYGRYFKDVSIFIHDPHIIPEAEKDDQELGWLRLESLNSVKHFESLGVRLEYQNTSNDDVTLLRVWKREGKGPPTKPWVSDGCYNIQPNGIALALNDTDCTFTGSSSLYITFKYVAPDYFFKKFLLGDITFNAKYHKSGDSQMVNLNTSDFTNFASVNRHGQDGHQGTLGGGQFTMHYFRHKTIDYNTTGQHHLSENDQGVFRLYRNTKDQLRDVRDEWTTGWLRCRTNGNLSPRFDSGIQIIT